MAWKEQLVVLVCLTLILDVSKGNDAPVTCYVSRQCTLPCSIDPHGGNEVIHWYNTENNEKPVHSYYFGKDQLEFQDPKYKGRTSLLLIPRGLASLLILDVRRSDEGNYKCYTSTTNGNEEKFLNVKVYAPLDSVNLTSESDTLTCSAKGVYPAPTLVWSTEPPSDVQMRPPDEQINAQGLYSVTSTVDKNPNTTYICTVTAGDSTKRVSLKQQSLKARKDDNLIIPCNVLQTNLKDFTLIWHFNGDSVLTFDSRTSQTEVQEQWKDHVKYTKHQTAIELYNLNDNILSGTYRCEVLSGEFTYVELTAVSALSPLTKDSTTGLSLGLGISAAVLLLIAGVVFWKCRNRNKTKPTGTQKEQTAEMKPINSHVGGGLLLTGKYEES